MDKIEKIRAEIKRRKELLTPHKGQGVILYREIIKQLDSLLSFIDTISQPIMRDGLIDKIRAEIERRFSEYNHDSSHHIQAAECASILDFLDTLEEEADKSLDETATKFANTQNKNFLNPEIVKNIFIAGAEWQKEQMMKEAVDGVVEDWNQEPHPEITIPLSPEEFTAGDKVKLIILGGDKFKAGDRIIYHGNGYEITGVDDKWYKVKADIPSQIPELEINAISKDNEKDIKRQE